MPVSRPRKRARRSPFSQGASRQQLAQRLRQLLRRFGQLRRLHDEGGFDLFEFILGVIFVYIVICVLFNALAPNRGGCLSYFFMGWLFGRGNRRRPPRGPRPPMGGGGFGPRPPASPHPPVRRLWRRFRRRLFRGGGGGQSFGGGFGGSSFGGGSSRGGGGGRSF